MYLQRPRPAGTATNVMVRTRVIANHGRSHSEYCGDQTLLVSEEHRQEREGEHPPRARRVHDAMGDATPDPQR